MVDRAKVHRPLRLTAYALAALFASACGPSELTPGPNPAASDASVSVEGSGATADSPGGRTTDGGTDASLGVAAAAACNALPNSASVIQATFVAQSLPSGAGGTIENGTYQLTEVTYFFEVDAGAAPSETWRQTIQVKGGSFDTVTVRNASVEQRSSGILAASGSQVTFADACPSSTARGPYDFTASSSQLEVYVPSERRRLLYAKQ